MSIQAITDLSNPNTTVWADGVDAVVVVNDKTYGGYVAGPTARVDRRLQPTSAAIVGVSDVVIGLGGNEIAYAELFEAQNGARQVRFFDVQMNHTIEDERRAKKHLEPVRSSIAYALTDRRRRRSLKGDGLSRLCWTQPRAVRLLVQRAHRSLRRL